MYHLLYLAGRFWSCFKISVCSLLQFKRIEFRMCIQSFEKLQVKLRLYFTVFGHLGAAEQMQNTTSGILSLYYVVMGNMLANSCIFTHPVSGHLTNVGDNHSSFSYVLVSISSWEIYSIWLFSLLDAPLSFFDQLVTNSAAEQVAYSQFIKAFFIGKSFQMWLEPRLLRVKSDAGKPKQ